MLRKKFNISAFISLFACKIARLTQDAMIRARWGEASMPTLENTELACISLAQADEAVCRLLSLLGLEGYERTGAVDMTVERIREMGAASVGYSAVDGKLIMDCYH